MPTQDSDHQHWDAELERRGVTAVAALLAHAVDAAIVAENCNR